MSEQQEPDATETCAYDGCKRRASDAERCYWHREEDGKEPFSDDSPVDQIPNNLHGAYLRNANLAQAQLSNVYFQSAKLADADLRSANLTDSVLWDAELTGADLINTDLTNASLRVVDLSDAILVEANLTGANLILSDLTGATLSMSKLTAVNLSHANLTGVDCSHAGLDRASLFEADMTNARFTETDLTDASLEKVDLTGTILERANLTRADLFDATLVGAEFYGAITTDTRINENTEFGDHYTDEDGTVTDTQKARWCNRTIERLADENALTGQAREAFLRRRELKRQELSDATWDDDTNAVRTVATGLTDPEWRSDAATWAELTVANRLMGYGERLDRVAKVGLFVIVSFAFLYPVAGVRPRGGDRLTYPSPTADAPLAFVAELIDTLLTSTYFSVLTFTTLGFGDLQPVGLGRALATLEAGVGVTLFAVLVFVLGQRATR